MSRKKKEMSDPAIEVCGLTKVFNGSPAVDHIDLTVPKGSVFGFLGPNGAGKTTTQRMLVGLAKPTAGTAHILGYDIVSDAAEVRRRIGFLPDVPAYYPWMTGPEYLRFAAEIFGISATVAAKKSDAAMERAGLRGVKKKIGGYSRGMKQRLGIAQALINDPEVILMDEPTSALDPIGRRDVLDTIEALGKEITVFFSTHILNDVERVCDTVAILNKGKVMADQSLASLKDKYAVAPAITVTFELPQPAFTDAVKGLPWATGVETIDARTIKVALSDLNTGRRELTRFLLDKGLAFDALQVVEPSLEDIFMTMVEEA